MWCGASLLASLSPQQNTGRVPRERCPRRCESAFRMSINPRGLTGPCYYSAVARGHRLGNSWAEEAAAFTSKTIGHSNDDWQLKAGRDSSANRHITYDSRPLGVANRPSASRAHRHSAATPAAAPAFDVVSAWPGTAYRSQGSPTQEWFKKFLTAALKRAGFSKHMKCDPPSWRSKISSRAPGI